MSQPTDIHRADVIAAIRALATWLEEHPDAPTPTSVAAQYSMINDETDADTIDLVARVAAALDAPADFDDTSASCSVQLFKHAEPCRVSYTVHGSLTPSWQDTRPAAESVPGDRTEEEAALSNPLTVPRAGDEPTATPWPPSAEHLGRGVDLAEADPSTWPHLVGPAPITDPALDQGEPAEGAVA